MRRPEDVEEFLRNLSQRPNLQDWQYIQAIDALRILYLVLLQTPWAKTWSWNRNPMEHNHSISNGTMDSSFVDVKHQITGDLSELINKRRAEIRTRHYSIRTEESYVDWSCRYAGFLGKKPVQKAGAEEVRDYLEYLATERKVAASTQRQALNALVFLYQEVLGKDLGCLGEYSRPKRPQRLPVVLSRGEINRLFEHLAGTYALMGGLLYGAGLRLMECLRLRVADIDFDLNQIVVRDGKGQKDRVTMLPEKYRSALQEHLSRIRRLHDEDLAKGNGDIYLPPALERKYPHAAREWRWQFVFPSQRLSVDPRSRKIRRHHLHENAFIIYTHVLNKPGLAVKSPADL